MISSSNTGRGFSARIEQLLQGQHGQGRLFDLSLDIDTHLEASAQRYAALIMQKQSQPIDIQESNQTQPEVDYQTININQLDLLHPRAIGVETLAYHALEQLNVDKKLIEPGFNRVEQAAAIGSIIGRMIHPGSERETHRWLQQNTRLR